MTAATVLVVRAQPADEAALFTYVTVHAYTPKAVRRAVEAGVKCIEHEQLLDEPTMQLLGEKGIFLSLQALDEAPATQTEDVKAKKHLVVQGTDNAFQWAKKHHVKLAWGTDLMFIPAQNKNQNTDILKLKQWFTPAETDVYDQGRQRRLHWHRRS